ncbi:MAG: adenylosuccinate synthetase, partial [Chloroflexi bacterium]|nr:adenylosuccinate synthetase [Chloroflexota bacterium]
MSVVVVVGGQWGDEGKGKVVDILAERAELVVRYQGGNNAGHTVVNDLGKFALNLVPSGIFYPGVTCVIGNGVVVDPAALLNELETLSSRGIQTDRLKVSDRAHAVMPYHRLMDQLEEQSRGGRAIGTTQKGIGPAYGDKVNRIGIRMGDLLEPKLFREKLEHTLAFKNKTFVHLYGAAELDFDEVYEQYLGYGEQLRPHIADTYAIVNGALRRNGNVILEGAQGSLLDLDYGTYPYV